MSWRKRSCWDGSDRLLLLVVWVGLGTASIGQAPTASDHKLEFEVASVRQNKTAEKATSNFPLNPGPQFTPSAGHLTATNMLLLQYIVFAYKMTSYQIQAIRTQLPEWARTDHFDVQARAQGDPTKDEFRSMTRSLLADRFKMVTHAETREIPVFALVLDKPGKIGPKIRPHPEDDPTCAKTPMPQQVAGAYPLTCGAGATIPSTVQGLTAIGARKITMTDFVAGLTNLANSIDRPVVDETGLGGTFDLTLEWAPEGGGPLPPGASPQTEPMSPTFSEALKEQLGMKLVPKNGAVEVIVLDHVERPSEN